MIEARWTQAYAEGLKLLTLKFPGLRPDAFEQKCREFGEEHDRSADQVRADVLAMNKILTNPDCDDLLADLGIDWL